MQVHVQPPTPNYGDNLALQMTSPYGHTGGYAPGSFTPMPPQQQVRAAEAGTRHRLEST